MIPHEVHNASIVDVCIRPGVACSMHHHETRSAACCHPSPCSSKRAGQHPLTGIVDRLEAGGAVEHAGHTYHEPLQLHLLLWSGLDIVLGDLQDS